MPRRPIKAARQDQDYNLVVQVPGWFKNALIAHCDDLGTSLNQWVVSTLREALRAGQGLPPAPPARAPLPGVDDQIRAWAVGEKILMPCGKPAPCPGDDPEHLAGFDYCKECGIRVR